MRTYRDAKAMAATLRERLRASGLDITHSAALELVANQFGFSDWNVLSAAIAQPAKRIRIDQGIPVLRIFDIAKADEFYLGFLGFQVDWDHRFHDDAPLYRQISRDRSVLHLSEHHGDGSPGATVWVPMRGIDDFHRELMAARYRYARPGVDRDAPGGPTLQVADPFGNGLRFCEHAAAD